MCVKPDRLCQHADPGKRGTPMGNYRNFKLVTYFVAQATAHVTREELEKQLSFFEKYLALPVSASVATHSNSQGLFSNAS